MLVRGILGHVFGINNCFRESVGTALGAIWRLLALQPFDVRSMAPWLGNSDSGSVALEMCILQNLLREFSKSRSFEKVIDSTG